VVRVIAFFRFCLQPDSRSAACMVRKYRGKLSKQPVAKREQTLLVQPALVVHEDAHDNKKREAFSMVTVLSMEPNMDRWAGPGAGVQCSCCKSTSVQALVCKIK
jgi:hypothetical protein